MNVSRILKPVYIKIWMRVGSWLLVVGSWLLVVGSRLLVVGSFYILIDLAGRRSRSIDVGYQLCMRTGREFLKKNWRNLEKSRFLNFWIIFYIFREFLIFLSYSLCLFASDSDPHVRNKWFLWWKMNRVVKTWKSDKNDKISKTRDFPISSFL